MLFVVWRVFFFIHHWNALILSIILYFYMEIQFQNVLIQSNLIEGTILFYCSNYVFLYIYNFYIILSKDFYNVITK